MPIKTESAGEIRDSKSQSVPDGSTQSTTQSIGEENGAQTNEQLTTTNLPHLNIDTSNLQSNHTRSYSTPDLNNSLQYPALSPDPTTAPAGMDGSWNQWLGTPAMYAGGGGSYPFTNTMAFNPYMPAAPFYGNLGMSQTLSPMSLQNNISPMDNTFVNSAATTPTIPLTSPLPSEGFNHAGNFNDSLMLSPGLADESTLNSGLPDEWSNFLNDDDLDEKTT
jgi:hypothetical protein